MESEEIDNLAFAHQKLVESLSDVHDVDEKDKIVKEFIKKCDNPAVPDFPTELEWFNTKERLSFKDHLKGKLVLLDFFTYCCINCMHILPDLKEIEEDFSVENGLVVIGVHSAKFENEKMSSNILSAVQRYNITHPVVNDRNTFMWNHCGISCWPTLLLIGPKGVPLLMLMGEGHKDDLHLVIRNALEMYKMSGDISEHKLPLESCFYLLPEFKGPLLFPGKIASYSDTENNNLDNFNEFFAVSDTGNHRILIINAQGVILQQIGTICGFKDGSFDEARFNSPQGVVFQNENILYVADTENHAIRKIDLEKKIVETVAGTGAQGIDRQGGQIGTLQELSSPWDLIIYKTLDMDMSFHPPEEKLPLKDVLLIAMAGTHQIWALFLEDLVWWKFKQFSKGTCVFIAGSGQEENRNNSYPHAAAFAQPSGLALNEEKKELYVADSESSSIRRLSLTDGKVSAVVGGDKSPTNLFGFGDKDGKLFEAKLQHPIGLAMKKNDQMLFVADTYNHKLKKVNTITNIVETIQFPKDNSKDYFLNEPCGLCFNKNGNKIFLCDTNNHCIKIIELSKQNAITKVSKLNLSISDTKKTVRKFKNTISFDKQLKINSNGGKIILKLKATFTTGFSLTIDAPQKLTVLLPNEMWSCVPQNGNNVEDFETIISVPNIMNTKNTEAQKFYIECHFAICKQNLCLPKNFAIEFTANFNSENVSNGNVLNQVVNVAVGDVVTISEVHDNKIASVNFLYQ